MADPSALMTHFKREWEKWEEKSVEGSGAKGGVVLEQPAQRSTGLPTPDM